MLLVLTYHRIFEKLDEDVGFFDVSAEELEKHIRLVKRVWGDNITVRDLEALLRHSSKTRGFLVTFDDGTIDHYTTAAPVLERTGVRGIFFINTSRLGAEGYVNVQQCQSLKARGHAIESHAHEHKQLSDLSPEELHHQLFQSRHILKHLSLGEWDFLASPGGYYNNSIIDATYAAGYRLFRTCEWGYNRVLDPLHLESITINRRTAGQWFLPLISPNFETAKKLLYCAKERMKRSSLDQIYYRSR